MVGTMALAQFFSEYFCVALSVSFYKCHTLIFIYMLLLPTEQTRKSRTPSKKQRSFGNRGALRSEVRSLCRRVRKIAKSDWLHHIRLSAWNNLVPTGRILMKLDISAFLKKLGRKFKRH
jgi:hypothetical protein